MINGHRRRINQCCWVDKNVLPNNGDIAKAATNNSRRLIPLVGSSLTAIQQTATNAEGEFIFPRYVDEAEGKMKNDNASAARKKRLIALPGEDAHLDIARKQGLGTQNTLRIFAMNSADGQKILATAMVRHLI